MKKPDCPRPSIEPDYYCPIGNKQNMSDADSAYEQGYRDGYDDGYADGKEVGYAHGFDDGEGMVDNGEIYQF